MVTAQYLIDQGIVVENPKDPFEVIFNIPLRVKKEVVDIGGLEMFAGMYGWTEEVDGQPNSQFVTDKCKEIMIEFSRNVFAAAISNKIDAEADAQKRAILSQLL